MIGVLQIRKRVKERRIKKLLELGWTTNEDQSIWFHPRSGRKYNYEGAKAIEDLRKGGVGI